MCASRGANVVSPVRVDECSRHNYRMTAAYQPRPEFSKMNLRFALPLALVLTSTAALAQAPVAPAGTPRPAPRPDTGSTAELKEQTVPSPDTRPQSIREGVQIQKPQLP